MGLGKTGIKVKTLKKMQGLPWEHAELKQGKYLILSIASLQVVIIKGWIGITVCVYINVKANEHDILRVSVTVHQSVST